MHIVLTRFFIVYSAQTYEPLISNKGDRKPIGEFSNLSHHDVNSEVKFLSIDQKWIRQVLLCDKTLSKRVPGDFLKLLD